MVSSQFHYTKRIVFMPFLLAEIWNFQGSTHLIGVGSLSQLYSIIQFPWLSHLACSGLRQSCENAMSFSVELLMAISSGLLWKYDVTALKHRCHVRHPSLITHTISFTA